MTSKQLEKTLAQEAIAMRGRVRRPTYPLNRNFQTIHIKSYIKGGLRALELLRAEARAK